MEIRTRKRTRIKGYDYNSAGSYFLSICTLNRTRLLSRIRPVGETAVTELTEYGRIVENQLIEMNERYNHIRVDYYVIMPDHVHILLTITDPQFHNDPGYKEHSCRQICGNIQTFHE